MKGANGGYLTRCYTRDGMVKWRSLPDFNHQTICRAFGLNEAITTFDVSGGFGTMGKGGKQEGLIFQGPRGSAPIGLITIVEEREKFKDEDPRDEMRRLGFDVSAPMEDAWRGTPGFQPG